MRPMRSLLSLAVLSLGLSACALRPYYRQVLPPEVASLKPQAAQGQPDVTLRVVEPGTGRPLQGARVLLGTSRGTVNVTSNAEGLLRLPVRPELIAENPLLEVILPPGARGYALELVSPASEESAPQTAPQPAPQSTP
ncbi:hypothetical protein [Archangium sp.]|uniref:hypothetical protein n=1 Tax=Archangium sp. TaxID=1872627 RepID=UPI00389A9CDC